MSKALVVIHFYYSDQVDFILNNLGNISLPYDLYCTIGNQEEYENIKNKIFQFNTKAHIINVANVGYDVWPFVYIINSVDLSEYEYIIKLHTKRDIPGDLPTPLGNGFFVGPGSQWRDNLYAFIETKDNFNKCIMALKDKKIGMCARFNVIHGMANHSGVIDYAKQIYPKYICNLNDYCFVAGTMFIAKAAPFQILKSMNMGEQLFEKPTKNHTTQFAHVIERTIGEIIYKSGMIISDPFTPTKQIKKTLKLYRRLKWTKRFINYIVFSIPIRKMRRKFRHTLMQRFYMPYAHYIINTDNDESKITNKKVLYTCITGGYDDVPVHKYVNPDWDYVLFTDDEKLVKKGHFAHWTVKPLVFKNTTNVKINRWHKINAHILFPDYDYSLYLDSNIIVNNENFFRLVDKLIKQNVLFAVPNHPERQCIYQEAEIIKERKIDYPEIVDAEMRLLRKNHYPENNGLSENNILFRQHNKIKDMLDLWWSLVKKYSKRDQLSFRYALWKTNTPHVPIYTDENGFGIHRKSPDFTFVFKASHDQNRIVAVQQPSKFKKFLIMLVGCFIPIAKYRRKIKQKLMGDRK